jgi:hypothetical protein
MMKTAAVVLWLYACAGLLVGMAFMSVPVLGAPVLIGALSVAYGTYLGSRRPGWASILLVVGGILVGGTLGLLGDTPSLAADIVFGVIFIGFLPVLAGLWLALECFERIWRARRGSTESIE